MTCSVKIGKFHLFLAQERRVHPYTKHLFLQQSLITIYNILGLDNYLNQYLFPVANVMHKITFYFWAKVMHASL